MSVHDPPADGSPSLKAWLHSLGSPSQAGSHARTHTHTHTHTTGSLRNDAFEDPPGFSAKCNHLRRVKEGGTGAERWTRDAQCPGQGNAKPLSKRCSLGTCLATLKKIYCALNHRMARLWHCSILFDSLHLFCEHHIYLHMHMMGKKSINVATTPVHNQFVNVCICCRALKFGWLYSLIFLNT